MITNADILSFAPGAGYLAANDAQKGSLFNNFSRLNPLLARQIYALYFVINKVYTLDPTYSGMDAACNYLWEIMGRYGLRAQAISGGGGSIAPITPITSIVPYDFQVDSSSFIPTGGTTVTLPVEWTGLNIILVRGGVPQSKINDGSSACYSWDSTSRLLTLINAPATSTELIQIYPVI